MDFEILEGISRADIAFRVWGGDPVELFTAGAGALLAIMIRNPETVLKKTSLSFACEAADLEMLYYDFLSEFIFRKDSDKLLLLPEKLEINRSDGLYRLSCIASGEAIDRGRHVFAVDIKAATMHNLSVTRDDNGFSATIVVDV
ncbi:MAG TPA: archease [Spirochaetota bacterium]|nr:archease [Spirochaetota bacterium]HPC39423.1 archease [Spirochaetota bacterium]HPL17307.1 archease [Spirochaetota bacterium]HQF06760.1 archease [Spirochaetota bacterium]HQH95621.1 archease [Spirochaetota bacterium]